MRFGGERSAPTDHVTHPAICGTTHTSRPTKGNNELQFSESNYVKRKNDGTEQFITLLQNKIQSVSFNSIREDVVRFIPDDKMIDIWSPQYFSELVQKIKFN